MRRTRTWQCFSMPQCSDSVCSWGRSAQWSASAAASSSFRSLRYSSRTGKHVPSRHIRSPSSVQTHAAGQWRLRARRVDLRSAAAFIVAAFPGVFAGIAGADRISRGLFDPLFGLLLALMAAVLTFAPGWRSGLRGGASKRTLVDANGNSYAWSFDMRLGLIGSVFVGIVSALFGIGGGPIRVPFLVTVLNFPEHVATATSHLVLAATSLLATLIHATHGDFAAELPVTISTALGALIGAPIGARLSQIVSGRCCCGS